MKRRKIHFKDIYQTDKETGAFVIEVALDKYDEVFNEWDPAPYKKRDINHDLHTFLDECSDDIPLKYKLMIILNLPEEKRNDEKEQIILEGIMIYFLFMLDLVRKEIAVGNKRGMVYIAISAVFLVLAIIMQYKLQNNVLLSVLQEGLFIGGWVFLWETFNSFVFHNKINYSNIRKLKRFIDAKIEFRYNPASEKNIVIEKIKKLLQ
ncbi:MAG: hypothetical protein ABIH89_00330 [Elusimicrobiota bacterium]